MTDSFTVSHEYDGVRVDVFLAALLPGQSRSYIQKLISEGRVLLDDGIVKKSHILYDGDVVDIDIPNPSVLDVKPENIPLDILYEDDYVLVVNKPKGMVVHPGTGNSEHTLVNAVLYHCNGSLSGINGMIRPGIVHRIDKNTTGSIIVCKNDLAHESISAQIAAHTCERMYEGIVCGNISDDEGDIEGYISRDPKNRLRMCLSEDPSKGKYSMTHFHVIEHFRQHAYVSFTLETGRTHQIRAHMAHISHPLLGDSLYGGERYKGAREQCLHAKHIAFDHPLTGERISIDAPLPEYFANIIIGMKRN